MPCHGEHERLPPYLARLLTVAPDTRFVIVDDGSPAESYRVLAREVEAIGDPRVELCRYDVNRGKGFALDYGLGRASTEWVGMLDGDGAVPAAEVARMLRFQREHPDQDMIIASRVKMLGRSVERRPQRHLAGRVFATVLSWLFDIPVYDSQCGFKLFRRALFEACRAEILDHRWLWDTELLLLAHARGYRIAEFPVDWTEIGGSKVRIGRDSMRMLAGLVRFRRAMAKR